MAAGSSDFLLTIAPKQNARPRPQPVCAERCDLLHFLQLVAMQPSRLPADLELSLRLSSFTCVTCVRVLVPITCSAVLDATICKCTGIGGRTTPGIAPRSYAPRNFARRGGSCALVLDQQVYALVVQRKSLVCFTINTMKDSLEPTRRIIDSATLVSRRARALMKSMHSSLSQRRSAGIRTSRRAFPGAFSFFGPVISFPWLGKLISEAVSNQT